MIAPGRETIKVLQLRSRGPPRARPGRHAENMLADLPGVLRITTLWIGRDKEVSGLEIPIGTIRRGQ